MMLIIFSSIVNMFTSCSSKKNASPSKDSSLTSCIEKTIVASTEAIKSTKFNKQKEARKKKVKQEMIDFAVSGQNNGNVKEFMATEDYYMMVFEDDTILLKDEKSDFLGYLKMPSILNNQKINENQTLESLPRLPPQLQPNRDELENE